MKGRQNKKSQLRQSRRSNQIFQEEQSQNVDAEQYQIEDEKSQSSFQLKLEERKDQSNQNESQGFQQEKKSQNATYKYEWEGCQKYKLISKKNLRKNIWKQEQKKLLLENVLAFEGKKINWLQIGKKLGRTKILLVEREYYNIMHDIRKQMKLQEQTSDQQLIRRYLSQKTKQQNQKIAIKMQKSRHKTYGKNKFYQKQQKIIQKQSKSIKKSMLSLQKYLNKTSKKDVNQLNQLKLEKLLTQTMQECENNIKELKKVSDNYQSDIQYIENHHILYVQDRVFIEQDLKNMII